MNDYDEAALAGDPLWGRSYIDVICIDLRDKNGRICALTFSPEDDNVQPSRQHVKTEREFITD